MWDLQYYLFIIVVNTFLDNTILNYSKSLDTRHSISFDHKLLELEEVLKKDIFTFTNSFFMSKKKPRWDNTKKMIFI